MSCIVLSSIGRGVFLEISHCHNQFADDFLQNPMVLWEGIRLHPRLTAKDLG